jgi:hypothetical protein
VKRISIKEWTNGETIYNESSSATYMYLFPAPAYNLCLFEDDYGTCVFDEDDSGDILWSFNTVSGAYILE